MRVRRTLQQRLSEKGILLGFGQTQPNLATAEMAGMCGYDFLMLDCEHGSFSEQDYFQTLLAIGSTDMAGVVRLRGHDTHALGHYLDMGADGILVPHVANAEQAQTLARAMEYPPAGTRGFAAPVHRASRYGLELASHIKAPREGAFLAVMIESAAGVANVEEIVAIDGVDAVFVGAFDLSADLGCPGDFSQPAYGQALTRIEQAANAAGKFVGCGPHPGYPIETLVARGHRLLGLGADMTLIREAMRAQLEHARSRTHEASAL